jgi:hypothetical protein
MEITATPDLSKVKVIEITKLTKGFVVQASQSPHTLGPMNIWAGACATEGDVIFEVGKLLGLVDAEKPPVTIVAPTPAAVHAAIHDAIVAPSSTPPAAEQKPFDPSTDLPVTAENRDQVIDWLVERNIEPVKGVRNTTLTKMVEDEVAKANAPVVEPEVVEPEAAAVEQETTVEPAKEEEEIDTSFECKLCFGTSELPGGAPCPHCAKGGDLTLEIVRNAGNIILNGDEAKRDGVRKAIATACGTLGIKGLREVKDFNVAWKILHAEIAKVFNTDKTETDEWVM